jgi:hypothetical protein
MLPTSSVSSTIGQLDRDIAEAERLINEKVQSLLVALRKGADTMEAEARVRDMRRALELLYEQRRKLLAQRTCEAPVPISRAPRHGLTR